MIWGLLMVFGFGVCAGWLIGWKRGYTEAQSLYQPMSDHWYEAYRQLADAARAHLVATRKQRRGKSA